MTMNEPIQISVSRIAGPSRRCISSFSRWRGIGERYHSAVASPFSK